MNNPFEREKKNYDATPIPEELDERVRAGIAEGRKRAAARRRFRSLAGIFSSIKKLASFFRFPFSFIIK